MYFRTSVLRRSPTITDDYSVHQLSHNALLVLYQRPWTITNVSSNVIERSPERYGVTGPLASISIHPSIHHPIYTTICLSLHPSIHPSINPLIYPTIYLSHHSSIQPAMQPSTDLFACLFVCLFLEIHSPPPAGPSWHHRGGVACRTQMPSPRWCVCPAAWGSWQRELLVTSWHPFQWCRGTCPSWWPCCTRPRSPKAPHAPGRWRESVSLVFNPITVHRLFVFIHGQTHTIQSQSFVLFRRLPLPAASSCAPRFAGHLRDWGPQKAHPIAYSQIFRRGSCTVENYWTVSSPKPVSTLPSSLLYTSDPPLSGCWSREVGGVHHLLDLRWTSQDHSQRH